MGASLQDRITTVLNEPPVAVDSPLTSLRGVSERIAEHYHAKYGRPETSRITVGELITSEGALTTPTIPYGWHRKAGIDLASADIHPADIDVATDADRVLAQFSTAVGPSWTLDDGTSTVPSAPAIHDWDYRWDRSWKVWRLDGDDVTYEPTHRVTPTYVSETVMVEGSPYHLVSTTDLEGLCDAETRASATTYRVSQTSLVLASVLLRQNYAASDEFSHMKLLPPEVDEPDLVHGDYKLSPPIILEAPDSGAAFASTVVSTSDEQLADYADELASTDISSPTESDESSTPVDTDK